MLIQLKNIIKSVWVRRKINRSFNKYYIKDWIIDYWKTFIAFMLCAITMTIIFGYLANSNMSLEECKSRCLYYLMRGLPIMIPVFLFICTTYLVFKSMIFDCFCPFHYAHFIHGIITLKIVESVTKVTFNMGITYYPIDVFILYWIGCSFVYMIIYCILRLLFGAPNSYVKLNSNSLIATKNIECTSKVK